MLYVLGQLNSAGARIWAMIDRVRNIREITPMISKEYNVEFSQAEEDTIQFIQDLEERNVLTMVGP